MSDLIDNVFQIGEDAGTQCLQWVNNVTSGAGAGFATAGDLATYAQQNNLLSATPALGDVAVYAANSGGAGANGHAGIVTAISGNIIGITSTNWGSPGAGAEQNIVGQGGGTPTGYINPGAIGGKNIIPGGVTQSLAATTGTTSTNSSSPSGCQSLSDIFSESGASAVLGDIPIIGLAWKSATAPEKAISWALQPCVRWRMVFWVGVLVGSGIGLHLLLKDGSGSSPVSLVVSTAKKGAKGLIDNPEVAA